MSLVEFKFKWITNKVYWYFLLVGTTCIIFIFKIINMQSNWNFWLTASTQSKILYQNILLQMYNCMYFYLSKIWFFISLSFFAEAAQKVISDIHSFTSSEFKVIIFYLFDCDSISRKLGLSKKSVLKRNNC